MLETVDGGGGGAAPASATPQPAGPPIVSVLPARLTAAPRRRAVPRPPPARCDECARAASTYCGACVSVAYCGTECQRVAWRGGHDEACRPSTVLAESALVPAALLRGDLRTVRDAVDGGAAVNWAVATIGAPASGNGPGKLFRGTALQHAAVNSHGAVVQLLLARGAGLEAPEPVVGGTALTVAAGDAVGLLCAAGADVDARTVTGWTALAYACLRGDERTVRVLLEHGAEPNAVTTDPMGDSPLYICEQAAALLPGSAAERAARRAIARLLVAAGGVCVSDGVPLGAAARARRHLTAAGLAHS